MKPKLFPLQIDQGALFTRGFRLKSHGAPLDLNGYTARLQIRAKADETSPVLLDLAVGSGLSIDIPNARILIQVSGKAEADPSTADLSFDRAVYDLKIISPEGEPQKIVGGSVHYVKAVTHV
jgi:hypothetical protein